ncbi:MAG TPA: Pycsar system effector family protein [Acidimicrobiia bacterium]|nr:Pycsar system effector family protein [Acidimicrobiia bacterium]
MTDTEYSWMTTPGAVHPGAPLVLPTGNAERRDDDGVADDRILGPAATRWAHSLVEVARFELARADEKANTLFRFYGVVAALSIGLLAGGGWTPTHLQVVAQVIFWAGCATLLASGVALGATLYPRDVRSAAHHRLLYFGHVTQFASVAELTAALANVDADAEQRLVEQLLALSQLVESKYAQMRRAFVLLGAGTTLCLAGVLASAIVNA